MLLGSDDDIHMDLQDYLGFSMRCGGTALPAPPDTVPLAATRPRAQGVIGE